MNFDQILKEWQSEEHKNRVLTISTITYCFGGSNQAWKGQLQKWINEGICFKRLCKNGKTYEYGLS